MHGCIHEHSEFVKDPLESSKVWCSISEILTKLSSKASTRTVGPLRHRLQCTAVTCLTSCFKRAVNVKDHEGHSHSIVVEVPDLGDELRATKLFFVLDQEEAMRSTKQRTCVLLVKPSCRLNLSLQSSHLVVQAPTHCPY